jgi:hypothetical protein
MNPFALFSAAYAVAGAAAVLSGIGTMNLALVAIGLVLFLACLVSGALSHLGETK